MENEAEMLSHLQAALDLADAAEDHVIGAYLGLPMQILNERLGDAGQPKTPPPPPR